MEFQLRPGKPEDVPDFVDTFFDSFSTHTVTQLVFPPNVAECREWWLRSLSGEIKDPKAHFVVIEDVSTTPPTFAAFAKWNRLPATDEPFKPFTLPDDWPTVGDHDLALRFFGELESKHAEIMHGREHWYLELIATRKAFQRKGMGVRLVQWGIDRAVEEGWECYLDSTPEGRRLYQKLGFRTLTTTEFPEINYTQEFMLKGRGKEI